MGSAHRTALARLSAEQTRRAGLTNSTAKTATYDGFHPRHLAHIDEDGREVVAAIWESCELASMVPPQIEPAMAPLIPKAAGGYKELGWFPGLIRICVKARRPECQA